LRCEVIPEDNRKSDNADEGRYTYSADNAGCHGALRVLSGNVEGNGNQCQKGCEKTDQNGPYPVVCSPVGSRESTGGVRNPVGEGVIKNDSVVYHHPDHYKRTEDSIEGNRFPGQKKRDKNSAKTERKNCQKEKG